ncbi:radical SAM protein [Patescibacteria group bacterium]|nr:radical SAM protein [Patescibacteria group bacterium]
MANIFSKAKRAITMYANPESYRPKTARLIITTSCQFRCQMCTFWKEKFQNADLETIKYWIKELADFGIKEIDIGGGEPLLRNDLTEIIEEVKSYGIGCGLTTNGWLLSEIPFPPIDYCDVSIDGAKPETHDKIRGIKGAWERAIKAVETAKKHQCPVRLNFVLQADNYLELVDFCHLAKKLKVNASLIPVSLKLAAQPWISNDLSKYDIPLLKKQLDEALKTGVIENNPAFLKIFLKKLEKGPFPQKCLTPSTCVLIFTNSDVYPCGNFDVVAGNLSKGKSFKDIYKNYESMRKEVRSGTHHFCDQCVYSDIVTKGTIRSSVGHFFRKTLEKDKTHSNQ